MGPWLIALVFVLGGLMPARVQADSLTAVFTRANRACAKGDYTSAGAGYQQLIESGVDDPDVSYNLALAHAKAGHYGQAIRYFERSLRLAPGDAAASRDLERARQALGQKLASKTGEAVVATRPPLTEAIFASFRMDTLAIGLLVAVWLVTLCLFALRFTRAEALRLGLGICGALGLVAAGIAGFGLGVKTDWGAAGARGVVIADDVPLRDGPDEAAQSNTRLREGTSVRVRGRERSFVEVELAGDRRGYLSATDVGEI